MSDAMGGMRELRATLVRAQRELEDATERLETLERASADPTATALTPRAADKQRRKLIAVGVFSSLGTAALIAMLFAVGALGRETAPAPVALAPAPPPVQDSKREIPPPQPIVAEPAPVAPPPPAEPREPRAPEAPRPVRVARVNPFVPATPPARARESETPTMGALSIICLPQKCDQITDNGVALGPGHIINRTVPVGPHVLTLRNANGESKTMRVDIQAERLKELRVNLHPDLSDVF